MRPSDLAHAAAFLTRLPVPGRAFGDAPLDFARQCWAFPLVGALVGALSGVAGVAMLTLGEPNLLAAVLVAATATLITGALHEDGLADCADGFWGGRTPERRRTIMRDSAIGTYGTMALVAFFAAKVAVVDAHFAQGPAVALVALIAAGAVSRAAIVIHWNVLPPAPSSRDAKGESLALRFGRPGAGQATIAAGLALLACLLLPPWNALAGLGFATLATMAVAAVSRAKIGGFTGDSLGATALLCETAFLCGAVLPTSAA